MVLAFYAFTDNRLVFLYLPVFLIGVFVFQYRARIIALRGNVRADCGDGVRHASELGLAGGCMVAVPTGLLIALSTFHNHAMDRVGDVSYSLYLLHLPIGVSVIGLLSHWLPFSERFIGLLDVIGVAASAWAAWIMYQIIEKPSQEMSSAIRFNRRLEPAPQPAVAAAAE